jgi:hypothetical protein
MKNSTDNVATLLAKVSGSLLLIFAVFYKPSNEIRSIFVCVVKVVVQFESFKGLLSFLQLRESNIAPIFLKLLTAMPLLFSFLYSQIRIYRKSLANYWSAGRRNIIFHFSAGSRSNRNNGRLWLFNNISPSCIAFC